MRTILMAATALLASTTVALAAPDNAATAASGPISPQRLSAIDETLASDAFQGRAPGTPGEEKTVDYLIGRFKALGLQPGGPGGSWTQPAPLLKTKVAPASALTVSGDGARLMLKQGEGAYFGTARAVDRVTIANAPLVFVGYGVDAPDRRWDDFKGLDLKGKIAVVLVNDPDFAAKPGEPVYGRFAGQAMTYYGRWTYKYEEAARKGALGVLIVHQTAAAGYPWSVVVAPQGETYDVIRAAGSTPPVLLQGWVPEATAVDLFHRAGLDFQAEAVKARSPDFRPVVLKGETLSADLPVAHETIQSKNVLARIPGTTRPNETVMVGAHWDAYGIGAPDAQGRTIRRGANDDGLGVSGALEIARAFAEAPKPQRSVVFALWTAEERGLLGSETYALHPVYPVATTVADLTMDILDTAGPSHDVVLIGAGQDSLEADLAQAAATQGRTVTPDSHPERGLFYRADHFSLAKRGVPTLLLMAIGAGPDLVNGGRAAGDRWVADYTAHCYHKPCDAWSPDWDLRGAAQDVDLLYDVARNLANSDAWPTWSATSEFKAVRAETSAARR